MTHLAREMERVHGVPYRKVSYFGLEDTADALYAVSEFFGDPEVSRLARELVVEETDRVLPAIGEFRRDLEGKRAAVYVGGAFKAFSLVKALRLLGMDTVVVGSQTGSAEDYEYLSRITDEGTIIVDDANPLELSRFILEKGADLLVGGVKERPIAYKMGIAFCDHNHERKIPLAGFEGMVNFAREVHASATSPVWRFSPARARARGGNP